MQLVDGQTPSFTGNVAWWGVVREENMARAGARWPAGLEVESESEAAGQTRWNVYMAEPPRILMCIRVVGGKSSWFLRCPAAKLQAMGLGFPGGACCGVLVGCARVVGGTWEATLVHQGAGGRVEASCLCCFLCPAAQVGAAAAARACFAARASVDNIRVG